MALIYDAELSPSKPELLASWAPGQPWFAGASGSSAAVAGSYRFDDPVGEVGIETFLVRFGEGPVLQIPFTYRGEPLEGIEPVATMEHSVLGRRWVYDGPDDPVYVLALASAVLSGGQEAALTRPDGSEWPSRGRVRGTGSETGPTAIGSLETQQGDGVTVIRTADLELELRRVVEAGPVARDELRLDGSWAGQEQPVTLVVARRR